MKNWAMEVADSLAEFYKERKQDSQGNYLRYLSVHDVEIDHENLTEGHQIFARVHYLSDIGDWYEHIIIRYFDSDYHYTLEKTQYDRLSVRTHYFPNIHPVPLMYHNEKDRILVYLEPQGQPLDEVLFDPELRYFQYGVLMGVIHGGETSKLNLSSYKEMSRYLVNKLPFTTKQKIKIINGLNTEFKLLDHSYAAYEPVMSFMESSFRFKSLKDQVAKMSIFKNEAFEIEILPTIMTEIQMDRMEDFATLFAVDAYKEFVSTGGVEQTLTNILSVMEGYEAYFDKYSNAPMDTIYPKGLSLDLHMAIGIWLHQLNLINTGTEIDIEALADYSNSILNKDWFQIYNGTDKFND